MKVLIEDNPLDLYCEASGILYKAVAHTLGPNGTNSAVVNTKNSHDIINDGYSIIRFFNE